MIRVLQILQALLPARAIKQRRIHMYIVGADTADGMGFKTGLDFKDLSFAVDSLYSQLYPL